MSLITLENVSKDFVVLNRREGLMGSLKDLFSGDYRTIRAIDDISLTINQGEVIGLLGPNGAGKSTAIKIMTGVMQLTSGNVVIDGMDPFRQRKVYSKNIGVVFGQRSQLWWELPVVESFKLFKEVYQVTDQEYQENMKMFSRITDIDNLLFRQVKTLSLGQRMLCEIIASMIHSPKILFLDEPTIGIDVMIKSKIRSLIKELNIQKKITVILTTHDMSDIDALCKRIVIIDHGVLVYDGDIDKVKESYSGFRTIKVELKQETEPNMFCDEMIKEYGNRVEVSECDDGWIEVEVITENVFLKVFNTILKSQFIKDVKSEDLSTESVVKKIYENPDLYSIKSKLF